MARTYSKPRLCKMCGKQIEYPRRFFCSDTCRKKADVIRMLNDRKFAKELGIEYEELVYGTHFVSQDMV